MSENIFLAIVGALVSILTGWKLLATRTNIVYNSFLVFFGIAIIIASIHKESKDINREKKYNSSDSLKNKKISDLDSNVKIVLHTLDSLGYKFTTKGNLVYYKTTFSPKQVISDNSSGVQINAPVYGPVAGRDMTVTNEPRLTKAWKNIIKDKINKVNKAPKEIFICMMSKTNGAKFAEDLRKYLIAEGFVVSNTICNQEWSDPKGVHVVLSGESIAILIGVL